MEWAQSTPLHPASSCPSHTLPLLTLHPDLYTLSSCSPPFFPPYSPTPNPKLPREVVKLKSTIRARQFWKPDRGVAEQYFQLQSGARRRPVSLGPSLHILPPIPSSYSWSNFADLTHVQHLRAEPLQGRLYIEEHIDSLTRSVTN